MREVSGPVTSEIVRQRLDELFVQLQRAQPPEVEDAPLGRRAWGASGLAASSREHEVSAASGPPAEEADDWLERLRVRAAGESERADAPATRGHAKASGAVTAFAKEHLATVVLVLLVAVAWAGYSVLQVRATPVSVPTAAVIASPGASVATAPSSAKQVAVHVIGAVAKPGVVKLPDGSRVADAIAAAGGLTEEAAIGELNLAQGLTDGTQLKVGSRRHPGGWIRDGSNGSDGAGSAGGAASTKVSLNSATVQQLDTLPGVGPVTAQKIVDWRKAHGKFTSIGELQEVDGIGPKTYADIAPHLRL